jgi:uncharacterized phiE125 gp8 family phage protein
MITLSDLKTYLQITNSDDDSLLNVYIDDATAYLEKYTENKFTAVTYSDEPIDTYDQHKEIILNAFPVTNVTLKYDGDNVDTDRYKTDLKSGAIYLDFTPESSFTKYTIDYEAGYTVTATSSEVPLDLQLIVKQMIKDLYQTNTVAKKGGGNITSKRLDDFQVSYGDTDTYKVFESVLQNNIHVINKYKRFCVY